MLNPTDSLFMTPAASARVMANLYSVVLLATLVLAVSAIAGWCVRRSGAEARGLVCRSAVVALLVVFVGREVPLHWVAWVVPSVLAEPLVALGRVQVTAPAIHGVPVAIDARDVAALTPLGLGAALAVYLLGIGVVLLPTVFASMAARRRVGRARDVTGAEWTSLIAEARSALGTGRHARVSISDEVGVAMTLGFFSPVVILPRNVESWTAPQRRMVLLHELAHVRAADWLFALGARVMCALLWFHPGAWWLAAELRETCELACDDRVLAAGARRSDYAELLVDVAERLSGRSTPHGVALALARPRGLRGRLSAVLDAQRDVHPLARGSAVTALALTVCLAAPMSVVQLAPTREVLTTLMLDAQWESRAYAVLGLAQRADSVAVARSAAERDPSPRVRAWAKYALGRSGSVSELRSIIHEQ
jgi:Antirepressor regulating drug resistance, predicted signal transduction N-terminal membrane component